jgi:ADP-ribose pyrophosphatase YjhB (NUDIX family)
VVNYWLLFSHWYILTPAQKFCSTCGAPNQRDTPPGHNRPRDVCTRCNTIHYINPRLVVGTIPVYGDKILLCKRAIEPRYGFWTLPAGFMECKESTEEGALRETWEEAGAKVSIDGLFSILDVPHVEQVHLFFKGQLIDGVFSSGTESLEVALFSEEEIPWENIAFRTVGLTLKWFFADRKKNAFDLHREVIHYHAKT